MPSQSKYIANDNDFLHKNLIRREILSSERLEQFAESVASEHFHVVTGGRGEPLTKRLLDNDQKLRECYRSICDAVNESIEMPPAAEWVIDNYFVLEEQIREIRNDLPPGYYRKLPKFAYGPLKHFPRIYAVALEFIAHTDSFFNPNLLESYIRAYQHGQVLKICELWAVSIALRMALVENLRRAAFLIVGDRKAREDADAFSVELLDLIEKDPKAIEKGLRYIDKASLSPSFVVQLIRRLRDQDARVTPFLHRLDERLKEQNESAESIVHSEHQNQGALTVTVRNIITSMRMISTFNWVDFFEKVSLVDITLRAQSSFSSMDLVTRNLYRRAIECLSERSPSTEHNVTLEVLRLCDAARLSMPHALDQRDIRKFDPGYYLVDKGRPLLENVIHYRPTWSDRILREKPAVKFAMYVLTNVCLVTSIIQMALAETVHQRNSFWVLLVLSGAAFFPAWEAVITIVNRLVFFVSSPSILPGLSLLEGIPKEHRTMVVVPVLLGTDDEIASLINQLQIHYLSNPDENLRFALLSDFKDADQEVLPSDAMQLRLARDYISKLNGRYACADGGPRFYLLHRCRQWNPQQGKWMGWERKRGKLHEFNKLLRGAENTSFILDEDCKQSSLPSDVRFIVTLDADTRLPRGSILRLVGKMCHPLNRACYDPEIGFVVDGYGVLQPRISSSLPERNLDTLFRRIFYSASGIDPYAFAISDVYQDLFEEGSFTGKGIYDLDTFEQSMRARIPENMVLSHDLIEGIFARAGLASDVEVVEDFPSRYDVASMRQSRWVRGDWQLLRWIFGKRSHEVPAIGYWKMVDNLRRTLTAPLTLLALLIGWTLPLGDNAALWTVLIVAAYTMPLLLPFAERLIPRRDASRRNHIMAAALDAWQTCQQVFCMVMFLPHQAWLMTNAITRTLWRLYVSHRNLLEWVTAAETKLRQHRTLLGFCRYMSGGILLTVFSVEILRYTNSVVWPWTIPFFLLWLFAPAFAYFASRPITSSSTLELDKPTCEAFRLIGRETWCFFEKFVTEIDNWLPPDNFQETPLPILAHRTSPTNIGLYMLAGASACDFGWIGAPALLTRLDNCLSTLRKMERHHGHFLNWYDTTNLAPLEPRYISSVDSGNLAACFLVVTQLCKFYSSRKILDANWIDGIDDTVVLLEEAMAHQNSASPAPSRRQLETHVSIIREELRKARALPLVLKNAYEALWNIHEHAVAIADLSSMLVAEQGAVNQQPDTKVMKWAHETLACVQNNLEIVDTYAPWMELIKQAELHEHLPNDVLELLTGTMPEIGDLAKLEGKVAELLDKITLEDPLQKNALDSSPFIQRLQFCLRAASQKASSAIDKSQQLARDASLFFDEMDFGFLLDPDQKLLSIGFRVADNALDQSYYDLLASEARLASIVAIAKGDIPESNWFRLGRAVTSIGHRPALISWSGSMFEYLMPSLFLREPEDSLTGVTNHLIVRRQISYGKERGVPWGVSESAYNARDLEMTYQYSSFGVPGLGLKRGLSENIVIAPYATGLAAMVDPKAALENYRLLESMGARGDYGWYEAVDFTSKRLPEGEKRSVVQAYMAHHQGMSLISIANIIFNGQMRDRFHSHPLIEATELLLQELPPRNVAVAHPRAEEVDAIAHIQEILPTQPRTFRSPHGSTPRTQLLSNGQYSVMLTTSGSGYSHLRDLAITRWREDPTRDDRGSYIYLRDISNGHLWSAAYQPTRAESESYEVTFHEDRAEYITTTGDLVTTFNILVCSEDQGEVRRLSLLNRGTESREIELTSFAELVLAAPAADIAHPAFVKMFVETEFVSKAGALLATRRMRSADEMPIWVVHVASIAGDPVGDLQYESDRARFIGRGNSVHAPTAMDGRPLSNTAGTVLDPVLSLRCRVRIAPGATAHVSFWTLVASSRDEALALAEKYHSSNAYSRAATIAWTQAQLQYQHLSISPEEAHLFQRLANSVLYADMAMRPKSETIKNGAAPQSVLWSAGVSGDLPIVLMRMDVVSDLKTLRQLVKAHTYWSMKGLEVDLVILNEQPSSYLENLHNEIELMVRGSQIVPRASSEGVRGKIHILRGDQISVAARNLLKAAARAVIVGHRGSLAEQLAYHLLEDSTSVHQRSRGHTPTSTEISIKRPLLEFSNGIGGFAENGREYVVFLEDGQNTPLPWINVIANPEFGFHISAEGAGYTWALNSRENKLTPWSNDAVSDEPGEVIYLRDLDKGYIWTPVAAPIRMSETAYTARHGFGYSVFETKINEIETCLTCYVPPQDPVKISRLKIRNTSHFTKRLSVTSFTDWVLGPFANNSAGLIVTEMDPVTKAMFVKNRWTNAFGERTAFVHLSSKDISWTGDKSEFIGRNGSLSYPMGLIQKKILSGKTGAGLDPCSALQTKIELKPGEEIEVVVLLGETSNSELARTLILKYSGKQLDDSLNEIKEYWKALLGQVQVETPDRSFDIMLNGWTLYQTIACRMWARSAFYQTSGAYGYRDQLQDVMTVAVCLPQSTRQHLLRAAGRQFPEGDTQHWWLPSDTDAGRGVRTRFSDDALWLPYVTAYYIKRTGDKGVLDEKIAFLKGPELSSEQHEAFFLPEISDESVTLYEHCARAIDKSLSKGSHGLGLFGGGDWNDGMNRVGIKGQGESVWLTWFIIRTIRDFATHAEVRNDPRAAMWLDHCEQFRHAINENAWDGEWYRRGYYDDGTPLGSSSSAECRIDSIAQSWAVISEAGDPERQVRAMHSLNCHLLRTHEDLALLFTPPFNHTNMDPGYIKGYPVGIRENGGQYTHAALWTVIAYALKRDGDKAHLLFSMLNPINHASSRSDIYRYKVEPYVVAADIYSNPQHIGRGGWTWYTGSSGWMYRTGLEYILGFQIEGDYLRIDPCIPRNWPNFKMTYTYKSTIYRIFVDNSGAIGNGVRNIEVDGIQVPNEPILLADDKKEHHITVSLA